MFLKTNVAESSRFGPRLLVFRVWFVLPLSWKPNHPFFSAHPPHHHPQTEEELELVNEVNRLLVFSLLQHPIMSGSSRQWERRLLTLVPAPGPLKQSHR